MGTFAMLSLGSGRASVRHGVLVVGDDVLDPEGDAIAGCAWVVHRLRALFRRGRPTIWADTWGLSA